MRYILILLIIIGYCPILLAKSGYTISGTITNNTATKLYLAHYYGKGSMIYKDDSTNLTIGTSNFKITNTKKITGGMFLLIFADKSGQAEMILNDGDEFFVSFDKEDIINTTVFKNSPSNTKFNQYQKDLQGFSKSYSNLNVELKSAKTKADTLIINVKSQKLTKELAQKRAALAKDNPNEFMATIFNLQWEPDLDSIKLPFLKDGKTLDSSYKYNYYKAHYWDKVNFKDDRIVYTPLYEKKLEDFFTKVIDPGPTSFIEEADKVLKAVDGTKDMMRYSLWWLTRNAESSKIMGMDEAFVFLIENYYMKGKAYWLDSITLNKYVKRAQEIAPNVIGKVGPDLRIQTITNQAINLSDVTKDNDYTILLFYSPTCGHCKKEVPQMDSLVKVLNKKLKVSIFGMCSDMDYDEWAKLIVANQLNDNWHHVKDPMGVSDFRNQYDVWSTPIVYVLDKAGVIVGKRVDHKSIEGLLNILEKKKRK
jgi:thiol-disulfide isomerase/thioredoxin